MADFKAWLVINNTSITDRYHLIYPMERYLNSRKFYKFYSSVILKGNCPSLSLNCGMNAVNVNKGNNM